MAERTAAPILGTKIRLTKLDTCGNPVTGASSAQVVTDGFISVNPEAQYEEGSEFVTKNAAGALCVNYKAPSALKRANVTANWCVLDPDAIVIMSGERLLTSGSATGSGVAFGEGLLTARFSLEVWQEVSGRGRCSPTGQQYYVYWAFPNLGNTRIGGYAFENAASTFQTMHESEAAGYLWNRAVTDGYVSSGEGFAADEHFLFNITTVAPPAVTNGAVALS
jgi:hypothetical protein